MASTLTTGGLGSGLDVAGMVAKLVAAERAPADARITKLDKANTSDLTAVSTLRGAMATFQDKATALKDATALVLRTATSANTAFFTATADSTASTGSYDIEVKNLAAAGKFTTVSLGATTASAVQTGTLAVTQGSTTFNVVINSSNNTLSGLRDAINSSASTTGVTASLLTLADGVHLQLNGGATGSANALSVAASNPSAAGDISLAALFNSAQTVVAANANITINGLAATSATNTFSGAIQGVTVNAAGVSTVGSTTSLAVANNDSAISAKVSDFVNA